MTVQPIVTLGDPRLRLRGEPVDSFGKYLHELLDDLTQTMRAAPGVGLAAPQIGVALQACVVEVEGNLHELVNPRIVRANGDDNDLEGCLSIPGYVAYVTRREQVWVVAQNRLGRKIKVNGSGLLSRAHAARARSPAGQAVHRLPRIDGRADPGSPAARGDRGVRRGAGAAGVTDRAPTLFFGTGAFAVPILGALAGHPAIDLRAVVSAPARRAARGRLTDPPLAEWAIERGLPMLRPARLRSPEAIAEVVALAPELIVLADYGQIVPATLIDLPRHGALNLHPSLLPRHRGATPINATILAGDEETGVSLIEDGRRP